jgi:RimJ/RimL family protein N-acetyltransferase
VKPVTLVSERLTLDQPTTTDRDLVTEYCRDPLFETFMTLPWPYEPRHADFFIEQLVPTGWATDTEYTWALRHRGAFLGVIGYRSTTRDLGYWLGRPHRGRGYMTEAATAAIDWLFAIGIDELAWECVVGNAASAAVARKVGFSYTGEAPTALGFRDGATPQSWHATLAAHDDRGQKAGWPT